MRLDLGRDLTDFHTEKDWLELLHSHDWKCFWCQKRITRVTARKDHLQPRSRGGSNRIENIAPACDGCNLQKGNMNAEEFMRYRQRISANCGKKPTANVFSSSGEVLHTNLTAVRKESEGTSWAWRNPSVPTA